MSFQRPLRLLCWQGYDHPDIIGPFEKRHGIRVSPQTLISDAATARLLLEQRIEHDVLNINNAYVAKRLHPAGRVLALDEDRFAPAFEQMLPQFRHLYRWARSESGETLIGICQRFGAFNLVINSKLVSRSRAEDEGFNLTEDTSLPFGVLQYDDFNIFHVCIAAGLNPFVPLTPEEMSRFEHTARFWFERATIATDDHHALNRALVDHTIAYYLSGGVYTASPARLAGRHEVEAITPRKGPIDGRGGIVFTEISSALAHTKPNPLALSFLDYMLEPETAIRIAFVEGTCNPVVQMGDPKVMSAFNREQLDAIQWDTLEEDIARCADYDIVPDHRELLGHLRRAAST